MGKNVAVFVDVANIFYAAKAAGVDIDYVTLLKSATAGRDLVRAYAYTGLDPDNENQRNFHDFLRRSNYKVVSKDIRKYGDGKVKANLDIELVVDMMKTARNLDIAIVVSGDGDFAPAIRAVQEQGVRVEVISFRGNTSSDLMDVADQFTDIVQLARVEKGSRSGRRVAEDDADLSMTEVPDKLTDGSGSGRVRPRTRGRARDEEPVAVAGRARRERSAPPASMTGVRAEPSGGVVALPGERLARAGGSLTEADLAAAEVFTLDDLEEAAVTASAVADGSVEPGKQAEDQDENGEEPRRRRRRGGRGRGRGRGRADEAQESLSEGPPAATVSRPPLASRPIQDDDQEPISPARRTPRSTPFGSVWDSQLGAPATPTASSLAPLVDEEDFDEPEIPEYLIAEQRRGANRSSGGRGGPRGGRSAYQSAMERERYGRGGGGGGINRYPDVSGRSRSPEPPREERAYNRADRPSPAVRNSNEPWSDVPPELEAMLRAQVAQKPVSRPAAAPLNPLQAVAEPSATEELAAPKRRSTRTPVGRTRAALAAVVGESDGEPETAPSGRSKRPAKVASTDTPGVAPVAEAKPKATAKPRAPRKASASKTAGTAKPGVATAEGADASGSDAAPAPKRRATRKAASTTES